MSDIPARPRSIRTNRVDLSAPQADTPSVQIVARTSRPPVLVTDELGRTLKVKHLGMIDHMRITRVLGSDLSKNDRYLAMATLAFCVVEMDGETVIPPIKISEVEFLVERIGEEGAKAIGKAYADNGWSKTDEDAGFDMEAAKN
jgi:hypothetical protein